MCGMVGHALLQPLMSADYNANACKSELNKRCYSMLSSVFIYPAWMHTVCTHIFVRSQFFGRGLGTRLYKSWVGPVVPHGFNKSNVCGACTHTHTTEVDWAMIDKCHLRYINTETYQEEPHSPGTLSLIQSLSKVPSTLASIHTH